MNGSWNGPSTAPSCTAPPQQKQVASVPKTQSENITNTDAREIAETEDSDRYNALVVDSGAIIKHSGFSTLHNAAEKYYTTKGVFDEIRDSKARQHLESLPFKLELREPSKEGIAKVADFSRKTGDYASLSVVDLQVLGLLYDLEKESCEDIAHIRSVPKHMIGAGNVTFLNKKESSGETANNESNEGDELPNKAEDLLDGKSFFEGKIGEVTIEEEEGDKKKNTPSTIPAPKKSWAALVNPTPASTSTLTGADSKSIGRIQSATLNVADSAMATTFGSMNLGTQKKVAFEESKESYIEGQFSDAEEDESIDLPGMKGDDDDSIEYGSDDEISDEECDIYILDPEEVEEKKLRNESIVGNRSVGAELESDFPSLGAASTVPYDGSDDEEVERLSKEDALLRKKEAEEWKRQESLKPLSKNGKVYNSFRGYKNVVSQSGSISAKKTENKPEDAPTTNILVPENGSTANEERKHDVQQSRVIVGAGMSGQGTEVEDDGEGWITSSKEIASMKAAGTLDLSGKAGGTGNHMGKDSKLPPNSCRAACATTDFAMQNVILQMNLELLSVDGVKVRKLKSWVTRCSACFKVYTGSENNGKRLFCSECGSDRLQRIAASVDGKTGRLKLHLRKDYQHNLRGTKYNLPKPGKGNRFKGDLLLREDQLLYGTWNQTMKKGNGLNDKQSIFGSDIASSVDCHMDLTKRDDIRVGFGRKNPNASRGGRERRGKKKKGASEKACGLRRY